MKKIFLIAFITLLTWGHAVNAQDDPRGTIAQVLKEQKLVTMIDLSAAPWQFRDPQGNAVGFAVDLNRLIAAKLDVDLEMRNVEWAGLIPALLTRKSDILATTMSTTHKRAQQVLFTTGSWYQTGVIAAVAPQNKDHSWEDYNSNTKRIAAKVGTNAVDIAKQYFPQGELQTYPNDTDTYQALKAGRVDMILIDLAVLGVVHDEYGFEALQQPRQLITSDTWSFAVRPGDVYTWQYLNFFLDKITQSGELDALHKYWVEGENWKADFMEKNDGISEERKTLIEFLAIESYVPESGKATRMTFR